MAIVSVQSTTYLLLKDHQPMIIKLLQAQKKRYVLLLYLSEAMALEEFIFNGSTTDEPRVRYRFI
jgi:hypothetical protein